MDTSEYLGVFLDESREHIEVLYDQLLELEKKPSEKAVIDEIFRAAHTLKGMSATMGYNDLSSLTHKLENVFDAIKQEKTSVQPSMMDIMFEAVDMLNEMVEDIASGGNGSRDVKEIVEHLKGIENGETKAILESKQNTDSQQEHVETNLAINLKSIEFVDEYEMAILNQSVEQGFSNFEISVTLQKKCLLKGARVFMVFEVLEKLGEVVKAEPPVNELEEENFDQSFAVLLVSEESEKEIIEKINKVSEIESVEINKLTPEMFHKGKNTDNEADGKEKKAKNEENQLKSEKKKLQEEEQKKTEAKKVSKTGKAVTSKTIRVNIDRLDTLLNLFEEFVIDRGRLQQIAAELNHHDLTETVEHMQRVSGDLQNIILNIRMVPIDTVFNRFPRMIRQLSRDLNKKVEVEIVGAETELDRTVIDQIGDPLVHLIRNAIDHGIEKPELRKQKGKPEQGILRLNAYHSGNYVFIEIEDDGAGINKDKVLQKAIDKGIVNEKKASQLTDKQIAELILASGFSTAEKVSSVSGRGVGLDVVKDTIESLGGKISIESQMDKGSIFSIQLPLTLSIISVLLVELKNEKYAIPLSSVIETAVINKADIKHVHHNKVIDFRDQIIPLVFLNKVFSVPDNGAEESEYVSVVIVKKGEQVTGLVVDSFIGQQEVVLKSLGNYLSNTFAISGATILGNGEVALIIDSNALSL